MTSAKQAPANIFEQRADRRKASTDQPKVEFDPANLISWLDELAPAFHEGIVLISPTDSIVYFSVGAERITGWSQSDILGNSIYEFFRFAENVNTSNREPATSAKSYRAEVQHRDGFPVPVIYSLLNPPAQKPQAAFSMIVFQDAREEDAAKKLRATFIASITHEFRTPLSSLNASVEFLLEEIKNLSRSEIETLLTSVHLSVIGLQTLIDNLLESLQIEAGRFNIYPRTSDLEKIIVEAARVISPLISRRKQTLKITLSAELPQVQCDPSRITQVLVNLLSNASKFGPTQQEIRLEAEPLNTKWIRVTVTDRGPGIPKQERGKIFQQYYRLGAKSNAQDGVGLGLWVVRVIIEQHGGTVGVDGLSPNGSKFWFTIPVAS